MKLVNEDFETIINEGKTIENWKKALEWWISNRIAFKEVMQKKLIWLKKVKKIGVNKVVKYKEIINNSLKYKNV